MTNIKFENVAKIRKLKKEIMGLRYSIDNAKPELQADFYKDYRTGKGIPKSVVGFVFDEREIHAREQKIKVRLKQLESVIKNAEEEIDSVEDPELRSILRLYYIEGETQENIGKILHIERSSVSKKLKKIQKL
ncbi:MAG: sigma factor-like helix-turn-helix DNA-binding protein [Clostridiales bacterium]|nr:sigma factor-like helix-turn-helix DNA-binding protein [Clostridiales bacterium]